MAKANVQPCKVVRDEYNLYLKKKYGIATKFPTCDTLNDFKVSRPQT